MHMNISSSECVPSCLHLSDINHDSIAFVSRAGSIVVVLDLQLEPYNTLGELSLVLYHVGEAASSSQLGGQGIMDGTIVVEIQGTNYTGMYMTQNHLQLKLYV